MNTFNFNHPGLAYNPATGAYVPLNNGFNAQANPQPRRGRPLRAEDTFAPQGPSVTTQTLIYAIRNDPNLLTDCLDRILRGNVRSTAAETLLQGLDACGAYLGAAREAAMDAGRVRHCTRCHSQYKEVDNHPRACVIEHDATAVTKDGSVWVRLCCERREAPGTSVPPPMYGRHTTQAITHDIRHKVNDNGLTVLMGHFDTCEMRGCPPQAMQF
ncbi:hypothetical protein EV715DRAFT_211888 [Schizophyllum commune]